MDTRDKLMKTVRDILVGPNPLPGFTQQNGEEILFFDSPLKTYVAGILFPQAKVTSCLEEDNEISDSDEAFDKSESQDYDPQTAMVGYSNIVEPTIEAETSKINSIRQSAMSITVAVPCSSKELCVKASVGSYFEGEACRPEEKTAEDGTVEIITSDKPRKCFFRKQHNVNIELSKIDLPNNENKKKQFKLRDDNDVEIDGLAVCITYRLKVENEEIYTITLLNTRMGGDSQPRVADCWFQVEFDVFCSEKFCALPDNFWAGSKDEDYKLNALLYRNVKTYAIGHGCAATWEDKDVPNKITASVLPEYEVKPISAGKSKAVLSMKTYFSDKSKTFEDLALLCSDYRDWIDEEDKKSAGIDKRFVEVAKKQIDECRKCLSRMEAGLNLLKTDAKVLKAFQLANKAMLMQQLHYRMPLTVYTDFDKSTLSLKLENEVVMPDINDENTWPKGSFTFGKWRPFQIAFLLLNLVSMNDKNSSERELVDLIWFPTGGGKTEAYLGLTAFTIFLRRLKNKEDSGTTVMMRYTLRLLTAQQYERASSLICAMEKIRSENESELGRKRITIGLWVGDSLTDNKSSNVVDRIKSIRNGKESGNVSIMLKCPWCGASMETFKKGNTIQTPGYFIKDARHVSFVCSNESCDYSDEDFSLPLNLFDDDIYENPPTLLFGTVDKFATLPYRPEAKSLFGGDGQRTPPELIIQDELHLITGPLGSAVGLYETLISELCKMGGNKPKIIASTATISHAKQQCNALYACGEEKVFQFPVQGTSYDNCFFAKEDKSAVGRKYVGLYGNAASSSATASIYTFAAFLYAAKAIEVEHEDDRDPYWTNLSYFGSMRELGQAATWYIADIKERLEVIYQNRLQTRSKNRRYIYESGLAELTSRMSNDDIPKILKRLETEYNNKDKGVLDMCLATNMVSVGVDVPRLGLMTVTGQPKSISEYIQATSRVGRSAAPGLVFVIYNTSKPRDKSHYEKFQSQHSKLYFSVEPTSVTPFSRPLRERALHAIFVALFRFFIDPKSRNNARRAPTKDEFDKIVEIITSRAELIDSSEVDDIKLQLEEKWKEWKSWLPEKFSSYKIEETAPLLFPAGTKKPESWGNRGWETPTSMRSVDRECGLDCSKSLYLNEGE